MSKWQDKSDFEINQAVAGIYLTDYVLDDGKVIGFLKREGVLNVRTVYNPCKNPSDAWAIISDNKISLEYRDHKSLKPVAKRFGSNSHNIADDNPLRAAMIVFLEMNGVKP